MIILTEIIKLIITGILAILFLIASIPCFFFPEWAVKKITIILGSKSNIKIVKKKYFKLSWKDRWFVYASGIILLSFTLSLVLMLVKYYR